MQQRIIIIGAGFAGMYAALSAARLRDAQGVSPERLRISLVSPEPTLVVRPRMYEPNPETLTAPLGPLLDAIEARDGRRAGKEIRNLVAQAGKEVMHNYKRRQAAAG